MGLDAFQHFAANIQIGKLELYAWACRLGAPVDERRTDYNPHDEDDKGRALRNLRRYIQSAEKIVLNVVGGNLPGDD
jgi:hypothetical protein